MSDHANFPRRAGRSANQNGPTPSLRPSPLRRYRRSPLPLLVAIFVLGQLAGPTLAQPVPPPRRTPAANTALPAGQVRLRHIVSGLSNPLGIVNAGDGTDRLFVARAARDGARDREQGAEGRLLPRSAGRGRRAQQPAASAGSSGSPSIRTSRRIATCSPTTPMAAATSSSPSSGRTRLAPAVSASTADPLLKIEHSARHEPQRRAAALRPGRQPLYLHRRRRRQPATRSRTARTGPACSARRCASTRIENGGYTNPSSNPYHGSTPGRGEIWSIGLRNPWRASFDRETDALWIADVGQGSYEEINREPAGAGGRNYGWDCREGLQPYETIGCWLDRSSSRSRSTATSMATARSPVGMSTAGTSSPTFGALRVRRLLQRPNLDRAGRRQLAGDAEAPPEHLAHDLLVRRGRERRALDDRLRRRSACTE